MSADRTTTEYHLTSSGWIEGTLYCYGNTNRVTPRPPNAVETWELKSEQSSHYAPTLYDWSDQASWVNPDIAPEDREALRLKFPRPPAPTDNFVPYKKKKRPLSDYY